MKTLPSRFLASSALCFLFLGLDIDRLSAELRPIPDDAAQKQALDLIQEVYGNRIDESKTTATRLAMAKVLLSDATVAKDPINRFALYRVARELAIDAGDAELAVHIVKDTAKHFRFGKDQENAIVNVVLSTFRAILKSKSSKEQSENLIRHAQSYQAQATARDDFDHAVDFGNVAEVAARNLRSARLLKEVATKNESVATIAEAFDKLQVALAELSIDPADPVNNRQAGEFYCFMKGEWERGLPMLALGNDKESQAFAVAEIGPSPDPMLLGDGWWNMSIDEDNSIIKRNLQARAAHWYRKALPNTVGIMKAKIEKRMAELPSSIAGDHKVDGNDRIAESSVSSQDPKKKEVGQLESNGRHQGPQPTVRVVSLSRPYPKSYANAPTDKISVQYAVIEIAKQVGLKYDFNTSYKNTNPICRRWVYPNIRNAPYPDALDQVLSPVGLKYEIENGTVILRQK